MASRRQPGDAVRGGVVSRRQRATASGRRTVAPGTASGDGWRRQGRRGRAPGRRRAASGFSRSRSRTGSGEGERASGGRLGFRDGEVEIRE